MSLFIDGGSPDPPFLSVSPSGPFNFGTVAVGSTASIVVTVSNEGGSSTSVRTVTVGGAPFSITGLPIIPRSLPPGGSFNFTLNFTPTGAVVSNDTLSITTLAGCDGAPFAGAISGTGTAATSVGVTPAIIGFPNTKIAVTSAGILVTVTNNGPGAATVNTIALATGTQFAISGIAPALPAALASGQSVTFTLKFTPLAAAFFSDIINIGTTVNNPAVPVSGQGIQLVPVAICGLNTRQIVFGMMDATPIVTTKFLDASNVKGLLTAANSIGGSLQFNGAIWNSPGFEKTLRRIEVFYENVGIASLTCTLLALRPTVGPNSFDFKVQSINLGTGSLDISERSAFFDLQISGEIILMQLVHSGGPLCILGFLPFFEPKGEKVENV